MTDESKRARPRTTGNLLVAAGELLVMAGLESTADKASGEASRFALLKMLSKFPSTNYVDDAIRLAMESYAPAKAVQTHNGYTVISENATGDLWLASADVSELQKSWEHYGEASSQLPDVFEQMVAAKKVVSPFVYLDDLTKMIYCQVDATGAVMLATEEEHADKSNNLIALLIPVTSSANGIPLFGKQAVDPSIDDGDRHIVNGLKFSASGTTNGAPRYINQDGTPVDGWYYLGKSVELMVTLPYEAQVTRVTLEVHEPDDRIYGLSTGEDYVRIGEGVYQLDFSDGPSIDKFAIDSLGNDINDWTGIKRVEVQAKGMGPAGTKPVPVSPVEAAGKSYRSGDPETEGAELMKAEGFHNAFRVASKITGTRRESFSNQHEFDELAANPDVAHAVYAGQLPLVLVDTAPRKHHLEVVCETLQSVITAGKLEVTASKLVAPNAPANMVCIGSDCLLTLPDKAIKTGWAIFLWMNKPGEVIENCVWQGGRVHGTGRGGLERVMGGAVAWTSNIFPELFAQHGAWPLNSKNCGIQAVVSVDGDADTLQTISHFWKLNWPEPPHGPVFHEGTFAHGCVGLVTPEAQKIHGIGEQFADGKAGQMLLRHCLMSGYIQNHDGDNSSHGDCIGTHYQMSKFRAYGCVFHSQRGVEIGSGDDNLVEKSLFLRPINGYKILSKAGQAPHSDSGMYHAVAYRDAKVGGIALSTELELRDCVFGGKPIVSDIVDLTRPAIVSGESMLARSLGRWAVPYGTTDPEGGIWYDKDA